MKRPPKNTPRLYEQDGKGLDALVYAHYFVAGSDWLVTEYDPEEDLAFGWARLNGDDYNAELGYVSLAEMESVRVPPLGLMVDWEMDWEPIPLREAIALLDQRQGLDTSSSASRQHYIDSGHYLGCPVLDGQHPTRCTCEEEA